MDQIEKRYGSFVHCESGARWAWTCGATVTVEGPSPEAIEEVLDRAEFAADLLPLGDVRVFDVDGIEVWERLLPRGRSRQLTDEFGRPMREM